MNSILNWKFCHTTEDQVAFVKGIGVPAQFSSDAASATSAVLTPRPAWHWDCVNICLFMMFNDTIQRGDSTALIGGRMQYDTHRWENTE